MSRATVAALLSQITAAMDRCRLDPEECVSPLLRLAAQQAAKAGFDLDRLAAELALALKGTPVLAGAPDAQAAVREALARRGVQ